MVKVTLNLDYTSENEFLQSFVWQRIAEVIVLNKCESFSIKEVAE